MVTVMYEERGHYKQQHVSTNVWFLNKFLVHEVDDETIASVCLHLDVCKGVRTRVKLNNKGWTTGYRKTKIQYLRHKLPRERISLSRLLYMIQDVQCVNVLLVMYVTEGQAGQSENGIYISAYKFRDGQEIAPFLNLCGQFEIRTELNRSLLPGRPQAVGTLAPQRWAQTDGSSTYYYSGYQVEPSELSYSRSGRGYVGQDDHLIPADNVRGRLASRDVYDQHTWIEEDHDSLASTDIQTYRDVAINVNLTDTSFRSARSKPTMTFHRTNAVRRYGLLMEDIGCQVDDNSDRGDRGDRGSYIARMSIGDVNSRRSTTNSDDSMSNESFTRTFAMRGQSTSSNGTNYRTGRNNVTSLDQSDGSSFVRGNEMTSSIRRVYSRNERQARTPDVDGPQYYNHGDTASLISRSRSVEPFGRYLSTTSRSGINSSTDMLYRPNGLYGSHVFTLESPSGKKERTPQGSSSFSQTTTHDYYNSQLSNRGKYDRRKFNQKGRF